MNIEAMAIGDVVAFDDAPWQSDRQFVEVPMMRRGARLFGDAGVDGLPAMTPRRACDDRT